ncbi:D-alanyl-D-alanine carboxypeptidase family protein [Oceanidesulfovibrio marinus]|uniref:D-alanyl-D-alanine carboxypeptidase n=1 Tax=Oceanidesulfovibrio marinus TaxID=370038 RepID=A0A6P1ZC24_9BACT|nr:D-alanyl-D-alanine carboxypeptidase family protein [Oceanidesulfovibrio marinus]TVM31710.1 D-alanyl-D-alanine carboxypeptidase [Oceanidesulfovibrio marinus]
MRIRRATILTAILLVVLCVPTAHAAKLAVKSSLVMDLGTGRVLYEQDADRRIAPASLTKIMTLYVLNEMLQQGKASTKDIITVSRRADDTGGSTMNLKAGEKVTLGEVMRGMAIASGNDGCIAVAEHFGGIKKWVAKMNAKARELGMTNTTFKNPNGLPAEGQLTSARDMMRLAVSYIRRFPNTLQTMHCKTSYTHNGYTRRNSNRLLGKCDGVDGLKTGYVRASGFNIVATAKRNGRRIIAVVLGGKSWRIRNRETEKILDASFAAVQSGRTYVALGDGPAVPDVEPAEKVLASGADVIYSLQESSWRNKVDAKKRAASLEKRGFDASIATVNLGSKGTWHRVMIGVFKNLSEARQYKSAIAAKYEMGYTLILKTANPYAGETQTGG